MPTTSGRTGGWWRCDAPRQRLQSLPRPHRRLAPPGQGPEPCISQIARKSTNGENTLVWNFPVSHTFESTNVFGWPRIVLSVRRLGRDPPRSGASHLPAPVPSQVYGMDRLGRDVVRGYGALLLPTAPGHYTRYVRMFAPVSSSYLKEMVAWLTGNPSEYVDSKVVAKGEGREGAPPPARARTA